MTTPYNENAVVNNGALEPTNSNNIAYNAITPTNVNGNTFTLPNNLNTMGAEKATGSTITTPVLPPSNNAAGGSIQAITSVVNTNKAESDAKAKADAELLALQNDQATKKTGIQSIFDKLSGTETERNNLYKSGGVDTAKMAVDELTSRMEAETVATNHRIDELRRNSGGGLTGAVNSEIERVQRESLSKLADLSVVQSAALRKYSTAKDIADRQIEAETSQLKSQLDALKFFYDDNKEQLNKKDQRAYEEEIKKKDREYQESYDTKKKLADTKLELLKSATEQNAPVSVLESIQGSKTSEEAISRAGRYGGDALRKAQIDNIRSEIDKRNAESDNKIDPSQAIAFAQQYASTGTIPTGIPKGTFGTVAAIAKELPKSPGQILDKATGITPDKLGAAGDAYGALYSAIELSKELKQLDEKRVGGLVAGTLGKVFGSGDQQRYIDLRSQIVDLIARARSGAALTVSEERRYSSMLPGRWSESLGLGVNSDKRIDNFTNALTDDLKNKVNSKGWVVNGISTVKIDGQDYTVGDIIQNREGKQGRINPDGTITIIN